MDWHDTYTLEGDLKKIRDFLFEAVKRQDDLEIHGLKELEKIPNFEESLALLRGLEARLYSLERTARFAAPELQRRLLKLVEESPVSNRSVEISIALALFQSKSDFRSVARAALNGLSLKIGGISLNTGRSAFQSEGEIPLRTMLVDIERLMQLTKEISTIFYSRSESDDEIFKPSSVNPEDVKIYIDKAILIISDNSSINPETKLKLEEYSVSVNSELVKNNPSWRKIIGALVIVSTILGGLAVAPDAGWIQERSATVVLKRIVSGFPSSFSPDYSSRRGCVMAAVA